MNTDLAVVTVTAADGEWLTELARTLVRDGVIACANLVPAVRAIYRWEGAVEEGSEWLAIMHTSTARVAELQDWVAREHPYALAQFVVIPATTSPGYAAWVGACTAGSG